MKEDVDIITRQQTYKYVVVFEILTKNINYFFTFHALC